MPMVKIPRVTESQSRRGLAGIGGSARPENSESGTYRWKDQQRPFVPG
ncbi:MAG: hypothetical protein M1483_08305 [Actinobacteria bacterium]|nr:hypothetical protein [Actinomycetota bacterium]